MGNKRSDENIWLTQKMMGVLYDVATHTINYHLKNVFAGSELPPTAKVTIAAALELDDSSHGRSDRQDRDAFIDKAMASAGIPLIHFAAKRSYGVGEVKRALNDVF